MYQIIKNNSKPDFHRSSLTFLTLVAGLLLLTGCVTRERGCLDIAASNFDLDADQACDDCCVYPVATLTLTQQYDGFNFRISDTLYDTNGSPYKIRDMKYILSSWSWTDDHQRYTVDSVGFTCATGEVVIPSDILLIDTRQFVYTIGSFRLFPEIDSVFLTIGFPQALECVDPFNDSTQVILSNQSALWDSVNMSRAAVRMIVQRDLTMEVFDTLFVHMNEDIGLLYSYQFVPGFDPKIRLTVDYTLWFSDVDITDLTTFITSVRTHAPMSFSRTP